MIDSHCHLYFESIKNDFKKIIENAKNNKIKCILSINTDPFDFENHYNLIKDYKSIFISYGQHPENVKKNNIITLDNLLKFSNYEKVIGIGETGLDYYHSKENKNEQIKSFENHIECSYSNNLPLIIHQRDSENDLIDIIKNYHNKNPLKIVFHCFTGTDKLKNFCLDNNFYISLSGIITFKNAQNLRETIRDFPLNNILVETDSPFLSPEPRRGKVNEPANINFIIEYLSNFFKISINQLSEITDNNFYNLFSKAKRYSEISL